MSLSSRRSGSDRDHRAGRFGKKLVSEAGMEVSAELGLSVGSEDNKARALILSALDDLTYLFAVIQLKRWSTPHGVNIGMHSLHRFAVFLSQDLTQFRIAGDNLWNKLTDIDRGLKLPA